MADPAKPTGSGLRSRQAGTTGLQKPETHATLPLVRHVPTRWNEGGTGKERSRGWADVPPNPQQLKKLGPGIVTQLQQLGVKRLLSSDLPRAAKTAEWLGQEMDVPVELTRRLRTWDTGDMAGKLERETIPQRKKYMKYPDTKPPGGEPFEDFLARVEPELRRWLRHNEQHPDEPAAIVVHGHMVLAAPAVLNGGEVEPEELDRLDRDFPPGSVILVGKSGDEITVKRIHPPPGAPRPDEVSGHPPKAEKGEHDAEGDSTDSDREPAGGRRGDR